MYALVPSQCRREQVVTRICWSASARYQSGSGSVGRSWHVLRRGAGSSTRPLETSHGLDCLHPKDSRRTHSPKSLRHGLVGWSEDGPSWRCHPGLAVGLWPRHFRISGRPAGIGSPRRRRLNCRLAVFDNELVPEVRLFVSMEI